MSWKNTDTRYGSLSIILHWLMLVLIAGVYACIELKGNFPKGSDIRELLKQWHFMLGLAVLALVEKDPNLASTIKEWHEWAGVAGYWLIGLHAAAGLLHHFVSSDNTLQRMLPRRG